MSKITVEKFKYRMDTIRHGTCPICKKDWDNCPHSFDDLNKRLFQLKVKEALR